MPIGENQLLYFGAEDIYYNGNPSFSYFKAHYKEHTNFALQHIDVPLNGPNELSYDNEIILRAIIPRQGDLISHMYLHCYLPDIFSHYNQATVDAGYPEYASYRFRWIRSIGTNLIRKARLFIANAEINTIYGEWISIWHELFSDVNKVVFDEMIGNNIKLYAPEYALLHNGLYPTSTLDPNLNVDPDIETTSTFLQNPYNRNPSIRRQELFIPLNFYFSSAFPLSIPLIALQYHQLSIEITLRRCTDLYLIRETNMPSDTLSEEERNQYILKTLGYHRPPYSNNKQDHIRNFISNYLSDRFQYGENYTYAGDYAGWGFTPSLCVNYVFVGEQERTALCRAPYSALIEQCVRQEFLGLENNCKISLVLKNPIRYLIIAPTRSDYETSNIYSNYTNWKNHPVDPGSILYTQNELNESVIDELSAQNYNQFPTKFNYSQYQEFIIKNMILLLNGNQRFNVTDNCYFRTVQLYQHHAVGSIPGLQLYSFSIDLQKVIQPSGALNTSMIKTIELIIQFNNIPTDVNGNPMYNYNLYVYTSNYNHLIVTSGMGGIQYVS